MSDISVKTTFYFETLLHKQLGAALHDFDHQMSLAQIVFKHCVINPFRDTEIFVIIKVILEEN